MDVIADFAAYLAEAFGLEDVCPVGPHAQDELTPVRVSRSVLLVHLGNDSIAVRKHLGRIGPLLEHAPAGVLVANPGRPLAAPSDLEMLARESGLPAAFAGWAPAGAAEDQHAWLMLVVSRYAAAPLRVSATGFRVLAFMPTYNEADIIGNTLEYFAANEIDVHVIDNWSTDGTFELAAERLGRGVVALERFPPDGPARTYHWRSILSRVEELASTAHADWLMLHDADERRSSPWRGVGLRRALRYADRCGFNCVDHVVLNFWPTESNAVMSGDVEQELRHFAFSDHAGHFHQRKAWKNTGERVSLAPSAGHDVRFPDRRVYPFKFLMKHYPIRSQAHGERKVLAERAARWDDEERALGWHRQYDELASSRRFTRLAGTLHRFEPARFAEDFLIERLSGIGVFHERPWWATSPRAKRIQWTPRPLVRQVEGMRYDFLVDSYATERLKVLSVWSEFQDGDLPFRPHPQDTRGRSVLEHMVHQCVSEDTWFRTMLGIDVSAPPLPARETRLDFIRQYAVDSERRLAALRGTDDNWWEEAVPFFDVQRSRAWIMTRRIAHTAHHRGQQTAMLRALGRDLHSTYGPTADTGGLPAHGARTIYAYPSIDALLDGEARGGTKAPLPGAGGRPVTERAVEGPQTSRG